MSWQRQRSQGKRKAFSTARAWHKETGKPVYVLYDTGEKSYYASWELPCSLCGDVFIGAVGANEEEIKRGIEHETAKHEADVEREIRENPNGLLAQLRDLDGE